MRASPVEAMVAGMQRLAVGASRGRRHRPAEERWDLGPGWVGTVGTVWTVGASLAWPAAMLRRVLGTSPSGEVSVFIETTEDSSLVQAEEHS